MKKNKTVTPAVVEVPVVKRAIRKSNEEREIKITQYLQAAVYNCNKIGAAKKAAAIAAILATK